MMAILVQQGVRVALDSKDKKLIVMKDFGWEEANQKALSIIQLCIIDDVFKRSFKRKRRFRCGPSWSQDM